MIFQSSSACNFDIVALTETWLHRGFHDAELFDSSYQIFRRDRHTDSEARGGGVLIACKSCFNCSLISLPIFSASLEVELLALKISLRKNCIYLLCCYIPPDMINSIDDNGSNLYDILNHIIDHIHNMMSSFDELILLGDFNLPNIKWVSNADDDCFLPSGNYTFRESAFLNTTFSFGLHQVSNVKNTMGRQLDLVFSSDSQNTLVNPSPIILSTPDEYHPPITISFCYDSDNNLASEEHLYAFNFKKADLNVLASNLSSIDFDRLLSCGDLDTILAKFYSTLVETFSLCVPYERLRFPGSAPPWYNAELRRLRNKKNRLWKAYLEDRDKENGNGDNYGNFVICYNKFRDLSSSLYNDYINNMKLKMYNDPRTFFKFINIKKKNDCYPNVMQYENTSSSDATAICDAFASFFENAFTPSSFCPNPDSFDHINIHPDAQCLSPFINSQTILDHIADLPNDFTSGPDGIPPIVLKSCAEALVRPLQFLFQKSIDLEYFPLLWKNSYIIPIHKKGSKNDISNYRPIAKLSCIPKLFESIIYGDLKTVCKSIISSNQHGFLSGRSTTTNLLEFTSCTINNFVNGFQTDCVYTDFSKAFDKLSHAVIAFKLKKLGFPASFIRWISSYLCDRTYQVLFRGSTSRIIKAPSGVPQGSHLGPLLFILSIDDIVHLMKYCSVLIYADDIKMFLRIRDFSDCSLLQSDLNTFYLWCCRNNLELNIKKCEVMTFCRGHHPITYDYTFSANIIHRVESVNDLGVVLDVKLDFSLHINHIVAKSCSMLGFIKRWSREFDSILVTKQLYLSLVRPILEYASQVWSPHYSIYINSVESVQRKFVRFALRSLPWDNPLILPPYQSRLTLLDMRSLEKRREIADVTFVHQLLNNNIDSYFLRNKIKFRNNTHNVRQLPLLHLNPSRTNYAKFEPVNRMCISVNKYAASFEQNLSKCCLKRRLYEL